MGEKLVDDSHVTRQIVLVHLSDLHFGGKHRFNPEPTPRGDIPVREGYPTLFDKLREDLGGQDPGCPVAICITGDLTTAASFAEYAEAERFIRNLSASRVYGKQRPFSSIFFNVPGNHDVIYDKSTIPERLATFAQFLSGLTGTHMDPANPWDWPLLYDCTADLGLIVVCISSSIYVEKGKPDQDRGHVDVKQLARIKRELEAVEPERLHNSIRIALMHHHPVLIPALAEPGRGYDAVHNSGKLLAILRKFGFHMVLHGHKHDPHVFTEDSRSAFRTTHHNPILIAAGGSVGSTDLLKNRWNSYNRISIKWHPAAGQARILIETVGLSVTDEDSNELLPSEWAWRVLRREDLHFLRGECVLPSPAVLRGSASTPTRSAFWIRVWRSMHDSEETCCVLTFDHP